MSSKIPTSAVTCFLVLGSLGFATAPAQTDSKPTDSPARPNAPSAVRLAAAQEKASEWTPLFDGKTLKGWNVTDFAGHGEVSVDPNFRGGPAIVFEMGAMLTGLTWTNDPPEGEYEVTLEAMKLEGNDFFCALTFPAGDGHCSLVVGGWGGGVVGISSLDGMDASENETTRFLSFEKNRWYPIHVKVTREKIEATVGKEKVVDVSTKERRVTVRPGEIELAQPFGISAYQTKVAFRDLKMRSL